ncbi:hypothetical protein CARUB_v10018730mg [Capsella rubella]|uniref:non-specific serine/threonine protein kinase n=1 Tax=Capsella rubella TaxID=81985 RepID=R0HNA6_9BRAS|nr:hypothetical protein CARUB_v10018730mg [Capsella rubella]
MGSPTTEFCLILLFLFYHLPCALSQQELLQCDTLFQCGNITAGYPFTGQNRNTFCGNPSLKLTCNKRFNTTSLMLSGYNYTVLNIDNKSNILRLSRQDFSASFCSASFSSSPLPSDLFQSLPSYKTLTVFYACDPRRHFLGNFTCPVKGLGSLIQNSTYHKLCDESFTVTVPTSFVPEQEALNVTNLERFLRKGFEVKLKMINEIFCQECVSSGGNCGFHLSRQVCCKNVTGSGISCRTNTYISGGTNIKNSSSLIIIGTEVVGRGGFGTVYKGKLRGGGKVAVKVLKDSMGNCEDFINEVASMSQTSHVNIVSLLGFCYEGSKRAIVYEFLENGSLDQFISKSGDLDVSTLYGIALGVARGIEYLHYGCKTRIVHFDIKPQNVLLDDNLRPKVSDFGLAKLCEKQESILSLLDTRGTIGYIAPELFSRMYGSVSHKSDVYSYGMLVLEMIGAKNKERVENGNSNSSSAYFPDWIYKDLELGDYARLLGDELTREEEDIAKKMILVGLWCIQFSSSDRPSMNKVVEMMEGSLDSLKAPPNPKPLLHVPVQDLSESSRPSEESSVYSRSMMNP